MDLKQENMSVIEYEQKFVNLSKYSWEKIASEVEMCSRFEWRLNENICAMIGELDIKEFVVLFERAQRMKKIYNEKKQSKAKNESLSK